MSLVISLTGTDLSTKNIYTGGTFADWHSAPPSSRGLIGIPSRTRSFLSRVDSVAARTFAIPLFFNTATLAARQAALDWVKSYHRQQVTIRMDDGVTARDLVGTVMGVSAQPAQRLLTTFCDGQLTLLANDPTWRATASATVSAIGATPVALGSYLGTAPVEDWSLSITVSGGTDPRTFTITIGGTVSYTCTYYGTLGAHTLVANADNYSATNNGVDDTPNWSGGFPPLDLANGAVTIAVAASSGTATGVLTLLPRYY